MKLMRDSFILTDNQHNIKPKTKCKKTLTYDGNSGFLIM